MTTKLVHKKGESGSALTEAAIIIPVLILLIYWSSAMTDVMVLKIKSQEAARFALWELTVFRDAGAIRTDMQTRFADLKSPATVTSANTGLMMYPHSADLAWDTTIKIAAEQVALNGNVQLPQTGQGFIQNLMNSLLNALSASVDGAVKREKFNTSGSGSVTVSLVHAVHTGSIILNGGDIGPVRDPNELSAGPLLQDFSFNTPFTTERPMRLVYDSWKAWPRPAAYTTNGGTGSLVDPSVSPTYTYPVVDSMVSQQVNEIAFFGLNSIGAFNDINNVAGQILGGSISQTLLGGDLPTFFATGPMDHALKSVTSNGIPSNRNFGVGPVTILPVAAPDVRWAPGAGLYTNRLGDLGSSGTSVAGIDEYNGMGAGSDQSRYTVPYRINTKYWTGDGGTTSGTFGSSVSTPSTTYTTNNNYTKVFACRGHYFAGAYNPQITDPTKRYKLTCPN